MTAQRILKQTLFGVLFLFGLFPLAISQNVPMALKYQAVARNNNGEELKSETIDVRMSVIAGNPDGVVEWQEIHTGVQTSQFGLFSLLLGKGDRSGGIVDTFAEIPWSESSHYLKVEIKFDQTFLEMGTSQFLSVPYALYSQTSLTPGPEGPPGPKGDKGDPGDPATDDQTLSFDGENLSIQGGNTINLSGLKQYLSLKGDTLSLTDGNYVTLTDVVEDDDANPTNEIQDLMIAEHILRITGNQEANPIDMNPYLDNTDNQSLSYDPDTYKLTLASGGTVDLTGLLEDDDPDALNEIQDLQLQGNTLTITRNGSATAIDLSKYMDNSDDQQLSWSSSTGILTLENGGSANLNELKNIPLIGFRALKEITATHLTIPDSIVLKFENEIFDLGNVYNPSTGTFAAPADGVYSFTVTYDYGNSQTLSILKNNEVYTKFFGGPTTTYDGYTSFTFLEYLTEGETISIQSRFDDFGTCGIGTFSGFRVH